MSSGFEGTVPFWMGCHRVPGTEDPMKIRLETHPCEGGGSIAPCWAIVWQTCEEEEVEILVAYHELEPLAELLKLVAGSYRHCLSQNLIQPDQDLDWAETDRLNNLSPEQLVAEVEANPDIIRWPILEPPDDDSFLGEVKPYPETTGWGQNHDRP